MLHVHDPIQSFPYLLSYEMLLFDMGHHTDSEPFNLRNFLKQTVALRCSLFVGSCQRTLQTIFDKLAHTALGKVGSATSHILLNIDISLLFTVHTTKGRARLGSSSIVKCADFVDTTMTIIALDPAFFRKRIILGPKEPRLHYLVTIIQSDRFLGVQFLVAALAPAVLIRSKGVVGRIPFDSRCFARHGRTVESRRFQLSTVQSTDLAWSIVADPWWWLNRWC